MNRYIRAMEIGNAHEEEGITYYELKEELGIEFDVYSETTFILWYLDNFALGYDDLKDTPEVLHKLQKHIYEFVRGKHASTGFEKQTIERALKQKAFISGEASKQYIDYLELKESRESSEKALEKANESIELAKESIRHAKKSTRFAAWALVIAIITTVVSIGFSFVEYNKEAPTYPQPPFEVNISKPSDVNVLNIEPDTLKTK